MNILVYIFILRSIHDQVFLKNIRKEIEQKPLQKYLILVK